MRIQHFGAAAIAAVISAGAVAGATRDDRASEILASARQAIGSKVATLTSLSVQAAVQRNVGDFQTNSELELLLDLPDKYLRAETASGAMVSIANALGFNGDRPLKPVAPMGMAPGGGMVIRMGGPGGPMLPPGEKPTPEQQQQIDRQIVRSSRHEVGRLMLGWFAVAHPSLGAQYSYAGEAESADGKAYAIDVKNADGFAARLFVDERTHLPLMVTYQAPPPRMVTVGGPRLAPAGRGQAPAVSEDERKKLAADAERQMRDLQQQPPALVEFTLFFEDWREVDGLKFPHSFRRAQAGATSEEWTITKVKVNPKIDPKKFETN